MPGGPFSNAWRSFLSILGNISQVEGSVILGPRMSIFWHKTEEARKRLHCSLNVGKSPQAYEYHGISRHEVSTLAATKISL